MRALAKILFVISATALPTLASGNGLPPEQAEYCLYIQEGTLLRTFEIPDYCPPRPTGNADLFWNGILAAGALIAIGFEFKRRRAGRP